MCLDKLDSPEQMKKYLAKKPDVIKGYKVADSVAGRLYPLYHNGRHFEKGRNTSRRLRKGFYDYVPHFHSYVAKRTAMQNNHHRNTSCIISDEIIKKDVTATGFQCGKRIIVSKHIHIDPKDYDKAVGK